MVISSILIQYSLSKSSPIHKLRGARRTGILEMTVLLSFFILNFFHYIIFIIDVNKHFYEIEEDKHNNNNNIHLVN